MPTATVSGSSVKLDGADRGHACAYVDAVTAARPYQRFQLALLLIGALLARSLDATPAGAQEPASLWRPEFRKVQPFEYVLTAGLGAASLATFLLAEPRIGPRGPVLFDSVVRELVKLHDLEGRRVADTVGDVGYFTMLALPTVDVILTWSIHGDSALAWQMFAINLGALAWAGSFSLAFEYGLGRQRPFVPPCADAGYPPQGCGRANHYLSFPSGHVATASAGAGAICAHHLSMPLYGGIGDVIACAAGVGLAIMTGFARLSGDRHWATDVVAGAGAGVLAGYVFPRLYHYRSLQPSAASGRRPQAEPSWLLVPRVSPTELGGSAFGRF